MTLDEFMDEYSISTEQMSSLCDLSFHTIYAYLRNIRKPTQRTAEIIEKVTAGKVTVMELRGQDKRKKIK